MRRSLRRFCEENNMDYEHEKYILFASNENLKRWILKNRYYCDICNIELKYMSRSHHENISKIHNRNLYLKIKRLKQINGYIY